MPRRIEQKLFSLTDRSNQFKEDTPEEIKRLIDAGDHISKVLDAKAAGIPVAKEVMHKALTEWDDAAVEWEV